MAKKKSSSTRSKLTSAELRPFIHELRGVTDPTLLVLKGHLIAEQQLLRWIAMLCPNPTPIVDRNRMGFATLLAIAEALGLPGKFDSLWNPVKKLNELRNALAHQLDPKRVDKQIEELAALIFDDAKAAAKAMDGLDRTARLQFVLPFLHYSIEHFITLVAAEKAAHGKSFWEAGPKLKPFVRVSIDDGVANGSKTKPR